jgi:hypothetical protein
VASASRSGGLRVAAEPHQRPSEPLLDRRHLEVVVAEAEGERLFVHGSRPRVVALELVDLTGAHQEIGLHGGISAGARDRSLGGEAERGRLGDARLAKSDDPHQANPRPGGGLVVRGLGGPLDRRAQRLLCLRVAGGAVEEQPLEEQEAALEVRVPAGAHPLEHRLQSLEPGRMQLGAPEQRELGERVVELGHLREVLGRG